MEAEPVPQAIETRKKYKLSAAGRAKRLPLER